MGFGEGGVLAGLVIRPRAVELLATRGRRVASRVRVPIEGGEPRHLTQAIQQALAASSLKTRHLAVAIPTGDALCRFFLMPELPKAEVEKAIQFEVRKYIPFKPEALVWGYRTMPSNTPGQVEVVFSAIQRDLFSRLLEAVTAAGVQPLCVETRTLSLARLVESKEAKTTEFTCLIDIEEDAAHLVVAKNRLPYLTRDISLLLPIAPAASELPDASETQGEAGEEAERIDPRAQRLVSELNVSIDFFLREHPSTTITKILLCGNEMLIGPWCRWFSERLHVPVEPGTSLLQRHIQEDIPLSFAAALGLLAYSTDRNAGFFDFLKRVAVKAGGAASRGLAATRVPAGFALNTDEVVALLKSPRGIVGAVTAAALLAVFWFWGRLMIGQESVRLSRLKQARSSAIPALASLDPAALGSIKDTASAQLAWLESVLDQRLSVAAKLDTLARTVPEGIWFTSLTYEDSLKTSGKSEPALSVNGACFLGETAKELMAIQQFEDTVKRSKNLLQGFKVAQVNHIDAQIDSNQTAYRLFQLNCSSRQRL